jgi:stage II sporulation protein AB (anti-sigma F factor)
MKIENEMTLEFRSLSCNEAFARAVVGAFAAPLDPTMEELGDLKTAVSEAVTNCIVHAYPEEQGTIQLRCTIYEDRTLELQIKDQGVGIVDIQAAREPLFTTGGEERSGMGFTIMERFMTSLQVESQPGQGTTVTMTRKLQRGGTYT